MPIDYDWRTAAIASMLLVVVLFQKLFGIESGHAARASRGNRLAIAMVLDVAGNKHTWDLGQAFRDSPASSRFRPCPACL